MNILNQNQIETLQAYTIIVQNIAHDFYDEHFQPRPEVKKHIIENNYYGSFQEPGISLNSEFHKTLGDKNEIIHAIAERNYKVMPYKRGMTACTFILEDKKGDWSLLRAWAKENSDSKAGRDDNQTVLQPSEKIEILKAPPLEIMPFAPILHLESPTSKFFNNIDIGFVRYVIKEYLDNADLKYETLTDMAVLPNGQIVFADPGHSRRKNPITTDRQIQEQFSEYKKHTAQYPAINNLLDYMDAETGQWSQDRFFPR